MSGHVCGCARCVRTCPGVARVCECAGECGEPSRNRDMGFCFCRWPLRQPLPSPSRRPASWSHLVLLYFNKMGLGPCPGPGRAASLGALPGDSPRAAAAPAFTDSSICPATRRPVPAAPSPGVTRSELQGPAVWAAFSPASITASDVLTLKQGNAGPGSAADPASGSGAGQRSSCPLARPHQGSCHQSGPLGGWGVLNRDSPSAHPSPSSLQCPTSTPHGSCWGRNCAPSQACSGDAPGPSAGSPSLGLSRNSLERPADMCPDLELRW